MKLNKWLKGVMLVALAAAAQVVVAQQTWPSRPVTLVVPFAPGGLPDTVARVIAERMAINLQQPVVVENKPGGGGIISVNTLKQSGQDGHTILITDGPLLTISPYIMKDAAYDVERDLDPVALIGVAPLFLAANSKVPFKSMEEFIAYAKAHPGKLSYGSSGIGSIHHLTAEAMKQQLGLDILHVPYKGSSASVPAMIGHQVDVTFASPPSLMPFAESGRAIILASNDKQRYGALPDIPTIAEFAPSFDFAFNVVAMAKQGTPEELRLKISDAISQAVQDPAAREKLEKAGVQPIGAGPAELVAAMQEESRRVLDAAKLADIAAQ